MEDHALGELMPGKGSMKANGLVPGIAPTSKTHRRGQTHRVPSAKGGQKRQAPRKILEAWGDSCEALSLPPSRSLQEELGILGRNHSTGISPKQGFQTHHHSCSPPQKTLSKEVRLTYRPLGKGPATLWGSPALPQISWWGWAEEGVAGVCWAQVFKGWE